MLSPEELQKQEEEEEEEGYWMARYFFFPLFPIARVSSEFVPLQRSACLTLFQILRKTLEMNTHFSDTFFFFERTLAHVRVFFCVARFLTFPFFETNITYFF